MGKDLTGKLLEVKYFPKEISSRNFYRASVPFGPSGPPPFTELVRAAAAAVHADGPRQLADAIGLTGRDEDKAVRNWWNGANAPNYDGTMRLLAVAGWLTIGAAPSEPLTEDERAEIARQLAVAQEALERLRELGQR